MNDRLIDLARRARTGARPELEALLGACVGVVHALARARIGDTEAAESATADAVRDVARGIRDLDDPAAFPGWLHTIVSRRVAKHVAAASSPHAVLPEVPDPGGGPVDVAVATERAARLRQALAELPEPLREAVLLHFVEGMTYRDIAALLDTGLGTVVRRVRQGLNRLERELGER